MDDKHIMQHLKYNAQHFTSDEKHFFDNALLHFERKGAVADVHAPHVLELYRKIKLRQVDASALIGELESNMILLGEVEQIQVAGAKMSLEFSGGTLDLKTVELLLKIQKALADRQHSTLAGQRGNGRFEPKPAQRPAPLVLPVLSPPAASARNSPRRQRPLGHVSALVDAAKLLKKGR